MRYGDIILIRQNFIQNPIFWLIQILSGSRYAHSAIYYHDNKIIEITRNGLEISDIIKYDDSKMIALRYKNLDADKLRNTLLYFNENAIKYDYSAILYLAYTLWFNKDRTVANKFDVFKKFYCHQFIGYLYKDYGIFKNHWTNLIDSDFINNEHLEQVNLS